MNLEVVERMRYFSLLFLCFLLPLAACSQEATESPPVVQQIETPIFPPTWTPTLGRTSEPTTTTQQPYIEPPTPKPTATTTPSPSPQAPRPLTATANLSLLNCTVTTQELGIELYQAPYFNDRRILPTMEPGFAYHAVEDYPTMTRLLRNGQTAGWVDYRMLSLSFDGPDCDKLPTFAGDLSDFDDYLCFMVADPPAKTYVDSGFTETSGLMIGDKPVYVLLSTSLNYFGSCVGHAGPCFYVNPAEVKLVGRCDDLPRSAETIMETQLWSLPNPSSGSVIQSIPVAKIISVQAEHVAGSPPAGAPADGIWLRVKLSGTRPILNGWVWSSYIKYR